MKILAHIHAYPPYHNAGAEWMVHSMLRWMAERGHECQVLTTAQHPYSFEGVTAWPDFHKKAKELWQWCDVGITHLGRTGKAINFALQERKPIAYITHNTYWNRLIEVKRNVYVIYNTDWAKVDLQGKGYNHENIVVHPPVWFDDYHVAKPKRKYIGLINCNENKGGSVFVEVAKSMPDQEFIAVIGMYGDQVIDRSVKNITYIQNTPNIRDVYGKLKLLLMPSEYESYGRTAVEACCSGIPVIANGTPGLVEALGPAGIFVEERDNVQQWVSTIKDTLRKERYAEASKACLEHAKACEKRNTEELKLFETFTKHILEQHGKIHGKA